MAFNSVIQGQEALKLISKFSRMATFLCRTSDYSLYYMPRPRYFMERKTLLQIPVTNLRLATQWASGKPPPSDKKSSDHTKDPRPKITLIGSDNVVTVTTLQAAEKISQRHDLKLVKMVDIDTKTNRTVYKLMTGTQFHEEDLKQRQLKTAKKLSLAIKGAKTATFSSRISENDLQNRIKNILKWLAKSYEVRVIINNESKIDASSAATSSEKIYKCIEDGIKENGRLVQKRQSAANLKFQIIPPKKDGKDHKDDTNKHLETPEVV